MIMHSPSSAKIDDTQFGEGYDAPDLQIFVIALFFIFGGITSLNDIIIPKLEELFTLDHTTSMLVQSAFFFAYALFSLPAAAIVRRAGYMRTASIGLVTMMVGCLLFIPAARAARFEMFLAALFVLGAGITIVQVVANPLISLLGPSKTASSRLTFAQALNSLGTTIFPRVGASLILGGLAGVSAASLSGDALIAYRQQASQVVVNTYVGLAIALAVIAAVVWTRRNRLNEEQDSSGNIFHAFSLLKRPRFAMGTACIFLYVGAEVSIGSVIVLYLMQSSVLDIDAQSAGNYVAYYWGGALIGRFIGSWVLARVAPGRVLAFVATGAITLIAVSANTGGLLAAWSLLAIGLMNAVMFPTIFAIASAGLGARAAEGSGLIATAIVGGAVVPPLTGLVADRTGSMQLSLALPALCYLMILAYGLYARRSATS